ncbi:ABC transporter ATP-binding protein [Wenyingzhuangia fucanilytica]|uniref:ABC transporter ATP-binding protein n=1 Tax=Wenyingzhuangia fucanilytica TaxID=1790137 RepID=UPI0009F5DF9D|nr:ABC transporter ATP-binding protein [Wenyingzhuangia fucanilytica]
MKEIILKVENLSKQYRLGNVGSGSLVDDFKRFTHKLRGKEDPFLKIGETNDRSQKGNSDYVWALKDINFEVEKGDVIGIIGRNGAGKSTLLKILSKVTGPTTGAIKYNGKIASLLEVGTGFNGEMTGRENIFLNGAILGMTKKEIQSKIDEIIAFSGCERYIDTPVKRYSSGMTVRLAFAVAAFLEPDILIVDEVLAVGDAEFQKKAIGKMKDISTSGGRTVLFVSHNMASVKALCTKGILLANGQVSCQGDINTIVKKYEELNNTDEIQVDLASHKRANNLGKEVSFTDLKFYNSIGENTSSFFLGEKFSIELEVDGHLLSVDGLNLGVRFETKNEIYIASCLSGDSDTYFSTKINKRQKVMMSFDHFTLTPGEYCITISIRKGKLFYDQVIRAAEFTVLPYGKDKKTIFNNAWGLVNVNSNWKTV